MDHKKIGDDTPPAPRHPLSLRASAEAKAALDELEASYGIGTAQALQAGVLLLLRSLQATTREAALEAMVLAQKPAKKPKDKA